MVHRRDHNGHRQRRNGVTRRLILGTAEGRNVITAHAGTLPALVGRHGHAANGQLSRARPFPPLAAPSRLTLPGSALDGTTLTIPPGALGSAGTIGFSISSASTLVLPAGVTAVSPALAVTGPVGRFKVPATLRLPGIAPVGRSARFGHHIAARAGHIDPGHHRDRSHTAGARFRFGLSHRG
ncbi:MAG: hypothetical protein IPP90_02220 [Gemmatimonadaceae bacterium]|nr:hypothetical protein [Gemmatimonadaceae bacterium]